MEPGNPRFLTEERDTEGFWNNCADPKAEPHWRRPATDQLVEFCEEKGIRPHGHTITWGHRKWQHPPWLFEQFCPAEEKAILLELGETGIARLTSAQLEALTPVFAQELRRQCARRMVELALRYQGRIHSWDVVNESATDFGNDLMIPGSAYCKSRYGLMPGDYTFNAFHLADNLFPKEVLLNINDYVTGEVYPRQVRDLLARGCRIDIMGAQMHLFNPQHCLDIAAGKSMALKVNSPQRIWKNMEMFAETGLPLHLSEITITAPNNDERGQRIQAVITRNLYRTWFAIEQMMGITWWNVVDDCGAPGEPSVSGLFTRNMQPKPAFHELDRLINHDWKTNLKVKADADGRVAFRGFRGNYRLTWKGANGEPLQREILVE